MNRNFALIICVFSIYTHANELAELNSSWLSSNEKEISEILQKNSAIDSMPIINLLGTTWSVRDGALGSEVSPYIAEAIIYQTNSMLAWFGSNPAEFESWLSSIPVSLLTNYSGSEEYSSYLSGLKNRLVSTLSQYDGKNVILAKRVLAVVSETPVRVID